MSRDGFKAADLDVRFFSDPKVRRLARAEPDDEKLAAAIVVYLQTVAESWGEGERQTAVESEGYVAATPERVAALQGVGLLDEDGRVVERAWKSWFGPADARRRDRVTEGVINGLVSHGMPRDEATAEAARRGHRKVAPASPRGDPEVPRPVPFPPDRPAGPSKSAEPAGPALARDAAQPPPADADAPSSAALQARGLLPQPPIWPGGREEPSTIAEAADNLKAVERQVSPGDGRIRKARDLLGELEVADVGGGRGNGGDVR